MAINLGSKLLYNPTIIPQDIPPPSYNVTVTVDFGHPGDLGYDTTARTTVAASWVTANMPIMVTPAGIDTADHGAEDALLESLHAYVINRVPGVGFDLIVYAPTSTWGRHVFYAFT